MTLGLSDIPGASDAGSALGSALGSVGSDIASAAGPTLDNAAGAVGSTLDSAESDVSGALGDLGASLSTACIQVLPPGFGSLTFQFNPMEYSVSASAMWDSTNQPSSLLGPLAQFQGTGTQTLTMTILLDSTLQHEDIEADVAFLLGTCTPTTISKLMGSPMPASVLFIWGLNPPFMGNMTSVNVNYKMFDPSGKPLRAEVSISIDQAKPQLLPTNPTSGGLAARRTHTVVAGENLALIAHQTLGKPTMWRAIAEANGIDDPMRVGVGTVLVIPSRGEAKGWM
jgi:nucleoid-associated protein YgaU